MATILVADDEEAVRQLVAAVLQSAGHQVLTAANGLEAVALYRSYADRIGLVITDVRMPVMDGIQAFYRIRETRPDAKVIVMSGDSGDRSPGDALFLSKPFTLDGLRQAVAKALS